MGDDVLAESTDRALGIRQYAWKPGQSGNPGGKPPGIKALRAKLSSIELYAEELEKIAFLDTWDDKLLGKKLEALRLGMAYKVGPPGPLPEDMTVKDALLSMSLDKARELMEGTHAGRDPEDAK